MNLSSSRSKRSTPAATSSLFHSDPDENVRLWMQKYFPGVTISREEAIRQWLARPPEFRVQSILDSPSVTTEAPTAPDLESPSTQEVVVDDTEPSIPDDENPRRHWERASQPILTGESTAPADRSRKIKRIAFRLVACAALAFVIIKLLWAIPESHLFSRADSRIPDNKSRTVEPLTPAAVPVSDNQKKLSPSPRPLLVQVALTN